MSGGGSQRQLLYILEHLDRTRFAPQLYVITSGGELLADVPSDVPVHFFDQAYRPPPWRYPGQAHRARVRHLAQVLRDQKIDCVYDRTYHMTLITAGARRHWPTPHVAVVVTDPERDFETNPERFRWAKRRLLKRAYRSADRVIGVSMGVRQAAIGRYQLAPTQTGTIYNGFDIARIDQRMNEPLPGKDRKPADRFEIVASGRLHSQKGFADLLAAMHELVHVRRRALVHLRILGTGPLEADLKALAAHLKLDAHVTFAGFHLNPLPFYRQADLFCLSSLYEGLPNALVEAMLCQTPVLSTDCPSGPREVLADGLFGRLVPPASPVALADAIDDCFANPEPWRARTELARKHINRRFSLDASIQALEALITEVTNPKLAAAPKL